MNIEKVTNVQNQRRHRPLPRTKDSRENSNISNLLTGTVHWYTKFVVIEQNIHPNVTLLFFVSIKKAPTLLATLHTTLPTTPNPAQTAAL